MAHDLAWHAAAPLWDRTLEDEGLSPERFRRPALLRFDGDTFMEDLTQLLHAAPERLEELALEAESWRAERVGWRAAADESAAPKLFHPAHSRFYLVGASLVCRTAGLPDRAIDPSKGDELGFVMRRRAKRSSESAADVDAYDEYGWFGDRQRGRWLRVEDADAFAEGEERLPLFSLAFDHENRKRRLHAGLIPVGGREIYEQGAPSEPLSVAAFTGDTAIEPLGDPRIARFQPVLSALDLLSKLDSSASPSNIDESELTAKARESLLYLAVDLHEFLKAELPGLESASGTAGMTSAQAALFDYLNDHGKKIGGSRTWLGLVQRVGGRYAAAGKSDDASWVTDTLGGSWSWDQIEAAAQAIVTDPVSGTTLESLVVAALPDLRGAVLDDRFEDWTERIEASVSDADARERFLVVLLELGEFLQNELPAVASTVLDRQGVVLSTADQALVDELRRPVQAELGWDDLLHEAKANQRAILTGNVSELEIVARGIEKAELLALLKALVDGPAGSALATSLAGAPSPSIFHASPQDDGEEDATYVVRCVYRRGNCDRHADPVVSEPSRPFRLASFFDSDAPIRPIHIRMPADTSLEGFRNSPKGVSIQLSKELRKQMQRAQAAGMENLILKNIPGGKSFDLGVICSFSIPIITICALILLMIIVSLLNIVFFWLPYLRICLPVRK